MSQMSEYQAVETNAFDWAAAHFVAVVVCAMAKANLDWEHSLAEKSA